MEMLGGGGGVSKQCRTPDIMADAAYVMLTRDARSFTGNFVIGKFKLSKRLIHFNLFLSNYCW